MLCSPEGRVIDSNEVGLNLLGIGGVKALGTTGVFNNEVFTDGQKKLLSDGESIRMEITLDFDDAAAKGYIESTKRGVANLDLLIAPQKKDGVLDGFIVYLQDITQRRAAEDALRRSEERWRKVLENSQDIVYTAAQNGKISFITDNIYDIAGYKPGEVVGRNILEFIHPDDVGKVSGDFIRGIGTGKYIPSMFRALKKDGTVIVVEDRGGFIKSGDVYEVTGVMRDVTRRWKAEEELRYQKEKYRMLMENTMDVIFLLDMDLKYKYISPSVLRMRGFTPEEVMSARLESTMTPESLALVRRALAERLGHVREHPEERDLSVRLELQMYHKDGKTIWTEVVASFMYDAEGRPVEILGVTRDISERKRMEVERRILDGKLR
jgi:PAS domain S-box-containing protein